MCITEENNRHQTPSQTKCNIIIPVEQGFHWEMPKPGRLNENKQKNTITLEDAERLQWEKQGSYRKQKTKEQKVEPSTLNGSKAASGNRTR